MRSAIPSLSPALYKSALKRVFFFDDSLSPDSAKELKRKMNKADTYDPLTGSTRTDFCITLVISYCFICFFFFFIPDPFVLFFFSRFCILLVSLGLELVIKSFWIYTTTFTVGPLNSLGPCLNREIKLDQQR